MKKTEQNRTIIAKKAMLEALVKSRGIISTACEAVGIGRRIHYLWLNDDEDYKDAVEDINEMSLDISESKLHELIDDKNPAAVFFHLKTKGKKRGYIERQEIDASVNSRDHSPWDESKETAKEYCERILSKK